MSDRLKRILNLSKQTGDTVIVHDPTADHDLVVLPFEEYENLVSTENHTHGEYDDYLFEEMSERELIDKINRDIAIWRSYQELNERDRRAGLIEDQLTREPLDDPFEEDFSHHSDWHRVSDLVNERVNRVEDRESPNENDENSGDPIQTYTLVEDMFSHGGQAVEKYKNSTHIPMESVASDTVFEAESALEEGDDPVFFEEPNI